VVENEYGYRFAQPTLHGYEYEQGMIKKKPKAEELFFPPSLQRIQHYD